MLLGELHVLGFHLRDVMQVPDSFEHLLEDLSSAQLLKATEVLNYGKNRSLHILRRDAEL